MKISKQYLDRLIKEEIKKELDEAMQTELPTNSILKIYVDGYHDQVHDLRFEIQNLENGVYDEYKTIKNKDIISTLSASRFRYNEDIWELSNSRSEHGYGPLIYDLMMEFLYMKKLGGVTPDFHGVSEEARNLYKYYFNKRDDVIKTKLPDELVEERKEIADRGGKDTYIIEELNYVYSKKSTKLIKKFIDKDLVKITDYGNRKRKKNEW